MIPADTTHPGPVRPGGPPPPPVPLPPDGPIPRLLSAVWLVVAWAALLAPPLIGAWR